MGFFQSKNNRIRYGAIIDIGSGSVLVAIIASNPAKNHPDILWSKREYSPLRQVDTITQTAKNVMTSLLNALMLLNSEGRSAFLEQTGQSKLPDAQITIAAPWSYTVTKSISYKHDTPFKVSDELIAELLRTAQTKVEEELEENEKMHKLGLSVVCRYIVGITANGYTIKRAGNQVAKTLMITESSAIAQEHLITELNQICDKILPDTNLRLYSFILIYYYILKDLYPDTAEYCLVDITYEATELGVVRGGILQYTTHTACGSFTLARQIAEVLKIPLEEAHGYLQQPDPLALLTQNSEAQKTAVTGILEDYQNKLADLFHETGDSLAIPKKIFLHGDLYSEPFFKQQISVAAKRATSSSHAVYPISSELLTRHYAGEGDKIFADKAQDTALLISAQFFHTPRHYDEFEQL